MRDSGCGSGRSAGVAPLWMTQQALAERERVRCGLDGGTDGWGESGIAEFLSGGASVGGEGDCGISVNGTGRWVVGESGIVAGMEFSCLASFWRRRRRWPALPVLAAYVVCAGGRAGGSTLGSVGGAMVAGANRTVGRGQAVGWGNAGAEGGSPGEAKMVASCCNA